jgi:hypothetical protein
VASVKVVLNCIPPLNNSIRSSAILGLTFVKSLSGTVLD